MNFCMSREAKPFSYYEAKGKYIENIIKVIKISIA